MCMSVCVHVYVLVCVCIIVYVYSAEGPSITYRCTFCVLMQTPQNIILLNADYFKRFVRIRNHATKLCTTTQLVICLLMP